MPSLDDPHPSSARFHLLHQLFGGRILGPSVIGAVHNAQSPGDVRGGGIRGFTTAGN